MSGEHDDLWQALDALRDRNSQLEARMSAHDAKHEAFLAEFRESRRERKEQIDLIAHAINSRLVDFERKIDHVSHKVTEAHGMATFGKWGIGFVITVLGLLIAYLK